MCDECGWADLTDKIDGMLDSGDYEWAEDTLSGIHETVTGNEHATDGQHAAVNNIEVAGNRR